VALGRIQRLLVGIEVVDELDDVGCAGLSREIRIG